MTEINLLLKLCENDSRLIGAIQELEQLRRSQIQPAVKFLGNTIHEQYQHMDSELDEILNEYKDKGNFYARREVVNVEKITEEIIDLQFSCQTMLEGPLRLTKSQISDAIQKVKDKNHARSYHIKP